MKVCWFTNVPLPASCTARGISTPLVGGWMDGLAQALKEADRVELLAVTFVAAEEDVRVFAEGLQHYHLGIPQKTFSRELWFSPSETTRKKCRDLLMDFHPDVVHIHGTEYTYGLLFAEGEIPFPTVISLQGILGALSRPSADGLYCEELWKSHSIKEWLRGSGILHMRKNMATRAARIERRILSSPAVFVGRTRYDLANLRKANPQATYRHCDEIMRSVFYSAQRDLDGIIPRRIFSPSGTHPRKGLQCLLKAVSILKDEYPDIQVRVPMKKPNDSWRASGFGKFINRLIDSLELGRNIVFMGELSAEQMAKELALAEVFAVASYGDNSPNSLVEAMLVGTPAVVAFAGGIPSLVRDGETALCFPTGDEIVLAECLRMIFDGPELAKRLATQAQIVARERNDPGKIAQTMLDIYRQAAEIAR